MIKKIVCKAVEDAEQFQKMIEMIREQPVVWFSDSHENTTLVIDRNKWKKCEVCGKADGAITATYATEDMQGFTITNHSLHAKYCPECGRPLTEQAWRELERKVCGE